MTTDPNAGAAGAGAGGAGAAGAAGGAAGAAGAGAAQGFDWKPALGDSYATYQPLIEGKGWKNPGEALAGYANLEKMIGQDKVIVPGKDAKPEDWNAVYAKLGRPEKPDGYEFKKPENFDAYSDDYAGAFRAKAHELGLSAKQAASLHDWHVGQTQKMLKGGSEAQKAQAEKAAADLAGEIKKTWGADRDDKLAAAKRAGRHFGLDEGFLDALETKAGSFKMLDGLARLGAALKEDTAAGGNGSGAITSPEAARAELTRLESDKDFRAAYLDRGNPGHGEAVRRMTDLAQKAAPGSVGQGYR